MALLQKEASAGRTVIDDSDRLSSAYPGGRTLF